MTDWRMMRIARTTGSLTLLLVLAACGQTSFSEGERLERAIAFQEEGNLRAGVIELKNLLQENPDHLEARWRLGIMNLELGDSAAALADLERALSGGWESDDAPLQIARARLARGDFQAVVDQLQTWRLVAKQDVLEAHVLRGRAFLGLQRAADARQEFEAAARMDARHAAALTGLAQVSLATEGRETAEARRLLDEALKIKPDDPAAWDLLGEIQRLEEQLEEAEASFTRVVEAAPNPYLGHYKRALTRIALADLEGATRDYEQLRRLGRDLPSTAYVNGLLLFHGQDYQGAVEALEQSLRGNPNYLPAMFFTGASHYALGNWQQAETYLGRYLRAQPDAPAANHLLAAVRLRGGNVDDASALLQRALAANPGDVAALDLMASIHASRGDTAASLELLKQRVALDPESPAARMRLASALMRGGDREGGLAEMEAARDLNPDDADMDLAVVTRLLQEREFARALEEVARVEAKRPDEAIVHNLKAVAYLGLNQLPEAMQAFGRALELEPGNFAATRYLAVLAYRQGRADEARQVLEVALRHRPDDARLLMEMGNFEAQQGNQEQAVRFYNRSMAAAPQALPPRIQLARHHLGREEPRRALVLLEEIREEHADNPALLELLAHAQVGSGQLESGINTYRRLAEIAPDVAEVHFRMGVAQRQAGREREARRALTRAVELDGNHARALLSLAMLEYESGRHAQALDAARRVQQVEEHRASGYLLEGDIHRAMEAYPEALQAYENAYRATPSSEAATKRFDAARRMGEADPGREVLARRVAEYPDDHRARFVLASAYIEAGQYDEAVPHYEVLARDAPENAAVLNNLAFLYQRQGDARSLEFARKAHGLLPDDPRVQDTLGLALLDHGDAAEGLTMIKAAHEALPDDPAIAYHYGLALSRNDQPERATQVLTTLLSEGGEFRERADAESLLQRLR